MKRTGNVRPMRWVLCAAVWLAMIALVVYVALHDWGGVVITLQHGNGIRVSDLTAVIGGGIVAVGVTGYAWRTCPDRREAAIGVRLIICVMVWLIAMVSSLYIASETRLGPVVIPLSNKHGVHLSDLVVMLLGGVIAVAVTAVAFFTFPRGRRRDAAAPAQN